ncbi:MAG: hypothetical protein HN736_05785 [Anaerolineae bacterium]|jgi:Sec-independent protein translocase protein TatA|nr:hypothetical protein [Anaerolineae bacterium]MBT4311018.1 hypothetical protein [Anaerolineae bacterium]MBT4458101.1 hypothetical protein [Anaerolineae bacterium]MBT4842559.1 hypothetical protein [Anaerolineae bacterium]MBT6321922.1 hypothetical protein [Anaerolineae bacterium]
MDILGIGIPELGFIILISLIVLGPKDMQKAGKTIGTWMRKVILSPEWREVKDASFKLKRLPTQLMREANLENLNVEELRNDLNLNAPIEKMGKKDEASYGAWSGTSDSKNYAPINSIAPPVDEESTSVKKTDSSQESHPVKKTAPTEKSNDA